MKKLLYTFLAVSIIFSACKKEDNSPTYTIDNNNNNNTSASIVGVWETTYANLDGTDQLYPFSHVYEFFYEDGTYGSEGYDLTGNLASFSFGSYSLSSNQTSLTYQIDYLDNDGDNDFTNGENVNISVPFDVTTLDNSNLHINTWNILIEGASVLYTKRLEKTNISLPPL